MLHRAWQVAHLVLETLAHERGVGGGLLYMSPAYVRVLLHEMLVHLARCSTVGSF